MVKRFIVLWLVCLMFPVSASAAFYKYRDQNGVLRFTDNLAEVPVNQRPKIQQYLEADDLLTDAQRAEKARQKAEAEKKAEAAANREKAIENTAIPEDKSLTEAQQLQLQKQQLDRQYNALMLEKKELVYEKGKIQTVKAATAYQKKVKDLNQRIAAFETRRSAYQKIVADFNAKIQQAKAELEEKKE